VHPSPLCWASLFNSAQAVRQQETASFLPPAAHTKTVQHLHERRKKRKENKFFKPLKKIVCMGVKVETKAMRLLTVAHLILSSHHFDFSLSVFAERPFHALFRAYSCIFFKPIQ